MSYAPQYMPTFLCPSILCLFLRKYLPSSVTSIIISQKQQCVEPRPVEIQLLVKRILYSFYIHIETFIKVVVSLLCSQLKISTKISTQSPA